VYGINLYRIVLPIIDWQHTPQNESRPALSQHRYCYNSVRQMAEKKLAFLQVNGKIKIAWKSKVKICNLLILIRSFTDLLQYY